MSSCPFKNRPGDGAFSNQEQPVPNSPLAERGVPTSPRPLTVDRRGEARAWFLRLALANGASIASCFSLTFGRGYWIVLRPRPTRMSGTGRARQVASAPCAEKAWRRQGEKLTTATSAPPAPGGRGANARGGSTSMVHVFRGTVYVPQQALRQAAVEGAWGSSGGPPAPLALLG